MRTTISLTLGILVLSDVYIPTANAAEWSMEPRIQLGAGYNDNIRLTAEDEASSTELNLSPSVLFSYKTPTSGLSGNLAFNVRRYPEESDLDDETTRLGINSFRNLERSALRLDIGLIRDTTVDTELEETGLVFDRVERTYATATPQWSYSFNERTQLALSYTHADVDYESNDSGYTDYTADGGRISLTRRLSEKSQVSISAGHNFTDNENEIKSQYTYAQAGGSYQLSETFSASLFVGLNRNKTEYTAQSVIPIFVDNILIGFTTIADDIENSNDGLIFNASVSKNFLRGAMSASVSRTISNSIAGELVEVNRVSLLNQYRFSETVAGNLNLTFSNSETTNQVGSNLDRNYYQIAPSISWKFKEFWDVSASYRYKKQTLSSGEDVQQNAAYLTLNYNWPKIAVSR